MFLLLLYAWIAGFVTVLSPCILPVLPLLLAAGADSGKLRPYGVILGLVASFTFFTLSLTALVQAFGISATLLRGIALLLIIFFGCTMLFPSLEALFEKLTFRVSSWGNILQKKSVLIKTDFLQGFVLGVALGLVWTPCVGPLLASVLTLVATRSITWYSVAITLCYSMGAALPMFFIMYAGNKLINSTLSITKYSETIRRIFGALMIIAALVMAFHFDAFIQQWFLKYLPIITIEKNPSVQKELENTVLKKQMLDPTTVKAPDFKGIAAWLNSPPLHLEDLKGKVVLIDFWTYSCINCIRTLPHLTSWYNRYKDKGLVIVGVHTPEFEFEKNLTNVTHAVKQFKIIYPVALDNEYKTWQAYANRYWPAHYLIDQNGYIRYTHFGEGNYTQTENAIRTLLNLTEQQNNPEIVTNKITTPETYLGYQRAARYQPTISIQPNEITSYSYSGPLLPDHVGLKGTWVLGPQSIIAHQDGALLELNFEASHVYLVMESAQPTNIPILLDGKPVPPKYYTSDMNAQGQILVHEPRMYALIDLKKERGRHLLTLQLPKDAGAYAFTFG